MGECPLTMYMWSPVRDSFPTVCSHSAIIRLRYGPIPTSVGRLRSGLGFAYLCASVTGKSCDCLITHWGLSVLCKGFLLHPQFPVASPVPGFFLPIRWHLSRSCFCRQGPSTPGRGRIWSSRQRDWTSRRSRPLRRFSAVHMIGARSLCRPSVVFLTWCQASPGFRTVTWSQYVGSSVGPGFSLFVQVFTLGQCQCRSRGPFHTVRRPRRFSLSACISVRTNRGYWPCRSCLPVQSRTQSGMSSLGC